MQKISWVQIFQLKPSSGISDEAIPCLNNMEIAFIAMFGLTLLLTLLAVVIIGIPQLLNIAEKSNQNMEFMDEDDTQVGRDRTAYKLLVHYRISSDSYYCWYVIFWQSLKISPTEITFF